MTDVKIKCDSCKFVDGCVDYGWGECKKFTQKPSELITNEEWFCQLTTEEKAKWLTNSGFLTCTLRDCEDCKYYDKNSDDCIDGYEATHDTQMWVEWLKQPHNKA